MATMCPKFQPSLIVNKDPTKSGDRIHHFNVPLLFFTVVGAIIIRWPFPPTAAVTFTIVCVRVTCCCGGTQSNLDTTACHSRRNTSRYSLLARNWLNFFWNRQIPSAHPFSPHPPCPVENRCTRSGTDVDEHGAYLHREPLRGCGCNPWGNEQIDEKIEIVAANVETNDDCQWAKNTFVCFRSRAAVTAATSHCNQWMQIELISVGSIETITTKIRWVRPTSPQLNILMRTWLQYFQICRMFLPI